MDETAFRSSLRLAEPPADLTLAAQALWWDAKGSWDQAHQCAQADHSAAGSAVHAYLHRKEPDPDNARYWYNRAGRPECTASLEQEWDSLAAELLPARA